MKQLYTLLVAAMVCLGCFAQKQVTINISDPASVAYMMDFSTYSYVEYNGESTVSAVLNGDLFIMATDGYWITSVTVDGGSNLIEGGSNTSANVNFSTFKSGSVISINGEKKPMIKLKFIGDPEAVYIQRSYDEFFYADSQVDGAWEFEDSGMGSYTIVPQQGYAISSVLRNGQEIKDDYSKSVYVYCSSLSPGTEYVFQISAFNEDETRTGSAVIRVEGDPELVRLRRTGSYDEIKITENPFTIRFNEAELPLMISSKMYNTRLYSVMLNDQVIAPGDDNAWSVSPADNNSVITVYTDFPKVDVPVTFDFHGQADGKVFRRFEINGNIVAPAEFLAPGYTVPLGARLYVEVNTVDYVINEFKFNGEVRDPNSNISTFITDENGYSFTVDATAKAPNKLTVICPDFENVVVYNGFTITGTPDYYLTAEQTVLEIPVSQTAVSFVGINDHIVTLVSCVEEPSKVSQWNPKVMNYIDGDYTVEVATTFVDRQDVAVFYLQTTESNYSQIRLSYLNYDFLKTIELANGYNFVNFSESDNPVSLDLYPYPVAVYKNNEIVPKDNDYSAYPQQVSIVDGDVVKIFVDQPAFHTVKYEIDESAEPMIFHDCITEISEPSEHQVLTGTQVEICVTDTPEVTYEAYANGEKLVRDQVSGTFRLAVSADTDVAVKVHEESGVANVSVDTSSPADVYNLQGIRVLSNPTAEQLNSLPAGIYVVGGRKRVVR